MKNLTFLTCIIIISFSALSQNTTYVYDNAGNRVQRLVIEIPSGLTQQNNENTEINPELSEEIKEKQDSLKIEDSKENFDFLIYPNPTLAEISVVFDSDFLSMEDKEIYIYDKTGTILIKQKVTEQKITLNLSKYASGQYFVKIRAVNFSHEWVVVKN
jgi:translation initiation factor 2 beta subunit (eIF-2beta)/eIF-5